MCIGDSFYKFSQLFPTIHYVMFRRGGERPSHYGTCERECRKGICSKEEECLCDIGVKGEQCDEDETEGRCEPQCGR